MIDAGVRAIVELTEALPKIEPEKEQLNSDNAASTSGEQTVISRADMPIKKFVLKRASQP
jgi:hypothetical protein